jgi:hypothetical protein
MGIEKLIDLHLVKKDNDTFKEFNLETDCFFSGKFLVLTICKSQTIEPVKNIIYADDFSENHYMLLSHFKTNICDSLSIKLPDYNFVTKGGGEIIIASAFLILNNQSKRYGRYDKKIADQLVNSYRRRIKIIK